MAFGVEVTGSGLDHARLNLDVGEAVNLDVAIQAAGQDELALTLLPSPSGFEALAAAAAGAAVQSLLPLVLDALAANAAIGSAVQSLGSDLGVRTGGSFSAVELARLAADPATELASRLRDQAAAILTDIDALLDDVVTGAGITISGRTITFQPATGYSLSLEIPVSDPIELCLNIIEAR
ncbi:MAG: hypothetical protein GY953_21245, partial [bacterium]|nr:hypothetical protein [bacterium]